MVKLPKTIYDAAIKNWYNSHKNTDSAFAVPFKYIEMDFRLAGYGKKKAFDWIVELTDLYAWEFDGAYVRVKR